MPSQPAPGEDTAPSAAAPPLEPPPSLPLPSEPPISSRELHARVSPAVVALVISGGTAKASLATGVLVTASGLVLTSRHALADAIDGTATVAMVKGGARGRLSPRALAQAVPARVVALSDELDLAVIEAMPTSVVFYPHLPIVRTSAADASSALAVGHAKKRGLWSATVIGIGPALGHEGAARWMRRLSIDASMVAAGTPLMDAVGRVVGLVTQLATQPEQFVAVDAEGLLRFLFASQAPAVRFAGVPPMRRLSPGELAALDTTGAGTKQGTPPAAGGAGRSNAAPADETVMPGIIRKGALDRHFATIARSPSPSEGDAPRARSAAGAINVTLASLERHAVPTSVRVDTADAPERGARNARVTVVELGDYHAQATRDAEAGVRNLVEGAGTQARLLWKDADRGGDGPDYLLAARAARAAAEQDEFWSMHDRLMREAAPPTTERVRKLAHDMDLNASQFDASLSSDGLASALDTDSARASRLPLLCTPAFVVNGQAVDGGSIAAPALQAAIDEELIRAHRPAPAAAGRQPRTIATSAPVNGAAFDADQMARVIASSRAGRTDHPPR